ncbi:hypothetical protein BC829DRAFT_432651 [Chytridium lagenaria]|nr:hypothetical protein BC829DRAFT_432651 [Chytridium lagenaria]
MMVSNPSWVHLTKAVPAGSPNLRFFFSPIPQQEVSVFIGGGLALPSALYHASEWILHHAREPKLFLDLGPRDAFRDIGDALNAQGPQAFLKDFPVARKDEVAQYVLTYLRSKPALLQPRFHQAFKSVLSMNNASGAKILPGSMIPTPNDFIVKLLRDILLSISVESRHTLQYLLSFLCSLSFSQNFKDRMSLARRLSTLFGPILIGTSPSNRAITPTAVSVNRSIEWSYSLCEILLHAHGLAIISDNNAFSSDDARHCNTILWKLNDSFADQIIARTPSRRSVSTMLTPRRLNAKGFRKAGGGSAARMLFKQPKQHKPSMDLMEPDDFTYSPPASPHSPSSPNYVVGDGSRFTSSQSAVAIERDSYRKRLRLG